ncbi:MAG: type II toxin-antitoxin system RelE/ParE family toxin [Sulfuricaulis sp.]|uniref:type II toxin-antitoxin system RelE/ParE family toxin n=1 Tax=Sulfuricaulis sp. TaxID=2003553 RepID=UPI0034A19260
MGKYKVFIKSSAVKEIEAIPHKKIRQQIVRRIQNLATDPRPNGSEKLTGHDRYRIRQGVYRIVYAVEDEKLVVYIVKVGHRKDVYRGAF